MQNKQKVLVLKQYVGKKYLHNANSYDECINNKCWHVYMYMYIFKCSLNQM